MQKAESAQLIYGSAMNQAYCQESNKPILIQS